MTLISKWALLWRSDNRLDGYCEHLIWDWRDVDGMTPKLFRTRREARAWKQENYGYINRRPDLRAEPHGWKPPKVVKVQPHFEILE